MSKSVTAALTRLASLFEYGELMAETMPEKFLGKVCDEIEFARSRLAALEEVVEQLPVCDYSINAVGEPCCEPATSYEIRRGDVLYYCERHSKGFPDDCRLPYRSALLKLLALKGGK